ncbi:MAG: glycosyltransferase family 2 protein [Gammaproteobacteria bacterium]
MSIEVSIIIVNFNSGSLLHDCLQSIFNSTASIEVIVVDNNSEDDSLLNVVSVFKNDTRLTIIRNSINSGFAHASNQGVEKANGDYWLFLNPDCVIKPDTISEMYELMQNNPDVGMSGPLIVNPDGSEQRGCRRAIPTPWRSFVRAFGLSTLFQDNPKYKDFQLHTEPLPDHPIDVEAISGAFMFVRTAATDEVGLLDDGYFLHCEDLDWCMRFRQKDWRILFNPNVTVTHLKGGCSDNRQIFVIWHMHNGMVRFYKKFFKDQYPKPLMWLIVIGVWLRFIVMASYYKIRQIVDRFRSIKTKLLTCVSNFK